MICDNTIGGAFMWRDYFEVEYAIYNNTLIFKAKVKYHNDVTAFSPPLGDDFRGNIEKIVEYCNANNLPVIFYNVAGYDKEMIHEIFSDFKTYDYEDWTDYIYTASDITTLAGRKFSGQRNHINYFNNNFTNHSFEVITKDNIDEVFQFYRDFHSMHDEGDDVYDEEYIKIN
jgi:hypothetical protein